MQYGMSGIYPDFPPSTLFHNSLYPVCIIGGPLRVVHSSCGWGNRGTDELKNNIPEKMPFNLRCPSLGHVTKAGPRLPGTLVLHSSFWTSGGLSQLTAYIKVTKEASPRAKTPLSFTEPSGLPN